MRESGEKLDRVRRDRNEQGSQQDLETSWSQVNPSLVIGDTCHFVTVESREHFEMPLSKEVDPFREVVLGVSRIDNGLETFLKRESKRRTKLETSRGTTEGAYHE